MMSSGRASLRQTGWWTSPIWLALLPGAPPQHVLETSINKFEGLRAALNDAAARGKVIPLAQARLRAPVPRPGKVLCGRRNFKEGIPLDPPDHCGPSSNHPTPSSDRVKRSCCQPSGLPSSITKPSWRSSSARMPRTSRSKAPWIMSLATLLLATFPHAVQSKARPSYPAPTARASTRFFQSARAIVTPDEVGDPNNLQIRFWVNGQLRQDYNTEDMEHSVAFMISTLSHNMTLKPGDLILLGVNHSHLGPCRTAILQRPRSRRSAATAIMSSDPEQAIMATGAARPAGQYPPPRGHERQAPQRDVAPSAADWRGGADRALIQCGRALAW